MKQSLPNFLTDLDPEIYMSDNYITLDFEIDTSYGDYGSAIHADNQMLLAVWKDHSNFNTQWGGDLSNLIEDIEKSDFIVCHNAKYELMWLKRAGLDLSKVLVFDTMLAEYVLMGNLAAGDKMMRPRSLRLNACCKRRGWRQKDPVVNTMMKHGINPVEMPRPWVQGRCERDVRDTEKLFKDQRIRLRDSNRLPVVFTRSILTPILSDIQFNGMCLDADRVESVYQETRERFTKLSAEMDELTGGISWRSSKQVGEFIYDQLGFEELRKKDGSPLRTATDKRKTDKATLQKLEAKTEEQKQFLKLREELGRLNAALTKTLEFFYGAVKEKGGIFYAEFNQARTATHRLSSTGIPTQFKLFENAKSVQFQNLPNIFKRLFKARRKGWKIGEADGSQLEFRVAAFLGRDSQAVHDIKIHHDVHTFTASVINQIPENEVNKLQRKKAKAHTFKPLYGGQSGTKDEQAYYKAFKERYSELAATQLGWVHNVLNDKRLITPWGIQYYWPLAKRSKSGYINVGSAVYNYPIQALATAEIIPIALTYFWHRVYTENLQDKIIIVNTVHDSIIAEVHPNHQDDFRRIAIQAFGEDVYNYLKKVYNLDFNVPLGAGIMLSDHWADDSEGEEEAYDIHINGKVEQIAA